MNGDDSLLIASTSAAETGATEPASRELLVLVVDDGAMDRTLAGGIITRNLDSRVTYAVDGEQAIERMTAELPDVVVTDLQMPGMDGLALVREVRRRFPSVPTILMTAHGSEEIAIAALQAGAASYVAKRNLAKQLPETIREIVALIGSGRSQRRLFAHWSETRFEFGLDNDASIIPTFVSHLQQYSASIRPNDETDQLRVSVALHEAIRNAMHHGNLELDSGLRLIDSDAYYAEASRRLSLAPYADRKVLVQVCESPGESRYLVRDEGRGFDAANLDYDPTDPANLERPSGRGIFLIRMFMDEVRFNDKGNEIVMIHRRRGLHDPPG